MLNAKGHNVRVINMGVNGDSTAGMLARVNSIPSGARLVLLEYAQPNEARGGIANSGANMAAIQARLQARGIQSIEISGIIRGEFRLARSAGNLIQAGGPHLNAAAYRDVAAQVLPQVKAAIGR